MLDVHAGKVLGSRHVRLAERVPQHDVPAPFAAQRSIGLGPLGQTLAGGALGGELARGESLGIVVRGDPEILGGELTLFRHCALGTREQHGLRRAARERDELVSPTDSVVMGLMTDGL